ncbi:MAG: M48 family metallopeptidase [Spirochaetales bacterium]|nr:M48 family metallopeptidase [Spirochaetales bacterium]
MKPSLVLGLYIGVSSLEFFLQIFLTYLNIRNVEKNRDKIPEFLKAYKISEEVYKQASTYTVSRNKFSILSYTSSFIASIFFIACGYAGKLELFLSSYITNEFLLSLFFIFIMMIFFKAVALPFIFYSHFILEKRYGFNKMSILLFVKDAVLRGIVYAFIFFPLIGACILFVENTGVNWWIYAFCLFAIYKLILTIVYPVFVAPLFNKYYPLPDGELKDALSDLARKLNFKTKGIYLMDGSRRSMHFNAYFTGLGKSRRVVFYDTLVEKLTVDEVVAILAHEIGHAKNNDVLTSLVVDIFIAFVALFSASFILSREVIFEAFNFVAPSSHAMIILVVFILDPMLSLIAPLFTKCSRTQEYEADRFAIMTIGNNEDLAMALMSISKENLCNFSPNKYYSYYNFSHPTLAERIKAIWSVTVDNQA